MNELKTSGGKCDIVFLNASNGYAIIHCCKFTLEMLTPKGFIMAVCWYFVEDSRRQSVNEFNQMVKDDQVVVPIRKGFSIIRPKTS